ncbi:MAG TPA: tetratricopeptide repeat protein [Steroidobacteraceae bacterium]|nr:tetratricopeptide repeat protein [Steroidobacteraceae bacterium]
MALTAGQFERARAAEERQLRVQHLRRLGPRELAALLGGDPAAALPWVRSAAEYGIPAAQLRLGRMLLEGAGTARDAAQALRWFARAAAQGDAEAMNMAGRCHENGWGVEVNLHAAAAHYRDSALRGHDWGEYNLGNMLFDGRGIVRDHRRALMWYLRAAHQGHTRAMNLAGRCLEEGWGCAPNPAAAARWYERSASGGYFRGQFNHAAALAQRGQAREAAQWYLQAAAQGDLPIRQAIVRALANAADPALRAVREHVRGLIARGAVCGTGQASPR